MTPLQPSQEANILLRSSLFHTGPQGVEEADLAVFIYILHTEAWVPEMYTHVHVVNFTFTIFFDFFSTGNVLVT